MTKSGHLEKSAVVGEEEDCSICETRVDFERIRRAFARCSTAEILNPHSLITAALSRSSDSGSLLEDLSKSSKAT